MLLRGKEPKYKKESGILLPLSSLPSQYGIGSLGAEAFCFVDFLNECNQTYWQLLPLVPVGKGNSPYSSESAFAGEILYIDIDELVSCGLLSEKDVIKREFSKNVDYEAVKRFKLPLLRKAIENFDVSDKAFLKFKQENEYWLQSYSLFMAIKESFSGKSFLSWDEDFKNYSSDAVNQFRTSHQEEIAFYEITQFLFYRQFYKLKRYANSMGIKLIGDIPFYVCLQSADVWANPECFKLGRDMTPVLVAGVPPDIFSSEGQLWGNPIYDWEFQKKNGYLWWQKRLFHNAKMYDTIRIDHFRAFADYYTIPYGAKNAKNGKWEKGVGLQFWNTVKDAIGKSSVIAEDLGGETPEVAKLIEDTGFPNMKILQFAFDSDMKDPFLPKNFNRNCVCYTGTHDNDTTLGWYTKATATEKHIFEKTVPKNKSGSPVLSLISFGMKSKARIVIIPLVDYMELDSSCRINTPGAESGNWKWRFSKEDINSSLTETVKHLSKGRNR